MKITGHFFTEILCRHKSRKCAHHYSDTTSHAIAFKTFKNLHEVMNFYLCSRIRTKPDLLNAYAGSTATRWIPYLTSRQNLNHNTVLRFLNWGRRANFPWVREPFHCLIKFYKKYAKHSFELFHNCLCFVIVRFVEMISLQKGCVTQGSLTLLQSESFANLR